MERELRRAQSTLHCLGAGVIAFGLWSLVKTMMVFFLVPETLGLTEDLVEGVPMWIVTLLALVIVLIVLAVDLGLRFYVGLSARREGRGMPQGRAYVVLAVVMLVFSAFSVGGTILHFSLTDYQGVSLLDSIATVIVDLTSTVILGELVFAAVRVKKLSGQER